jgi:hypothetical protein
MQVDEEKKSKQIEKWADDFLSLRGISIDSSILQADSSQIGGGMGPRDSESRRI